MGSCGLKEMLGIQVRILCGDVWRRGPTEGATMPLGCRGGWGGGDDLPACACSLALSQPCSPFSSWLPLLGGGQSGMMLHGGAKGALGCIVFFVLGCFGIDWADSLPCVILSGGHALSYCSYQNPLLLCFCVAVVSAKCCFLRNAAAGCFWFSLFHEIFDATSFSRSGHRVGSKATVSQADRSLHSWESRFWEKSSLWLASKPPLGLAHAPHWKCDIISFYPLCLFFGLPPSPKDWYASSVKESHWPSRSRKIHHQPFKHVRFRFDGTCHFKSSFAIVFKQQYGSELKMPQSGTQILFSFAEYNARFLPPPAPHRCFILGVTVTCCHWLCSC